MNKSNLSLRKSCDEHLKSLSDLLIKHQMKSPIDEDFTV